jgi:hypothetical protein
MSQIGISIQINTQIKVYIVKFYIYKKFTTKFTINQSNQMKVHIK